MGCGCLALVGLALAGILFFVYASTDAGPPVEPAVVAGWLGMIVLVRTLGVLGERTLAG